MTWGIPKLKYFGFYNPIKYFLIKRVRIFSLSFFLSYPTHILSQLIGSKVKGIIQQLCTYLKWAVHKVPHFLSTFRVQNVKVVTAWQAWGQKKTKLCPRSYWMTQKVKVFMSASYILDVLWGQPIKLIQVVSTSEFHEYWWNDVD